MATLQRQRIPEPGYLHPIELKRKYSLTDARLAILLGKGLSTVERYVSSNKQGERLPESVLIQSWLIDFFLSKSTDF